MTGVLWARLGGSWRRQEPNETEPSPFTAEEVDVDLSRCIKSPRRILDSTKNLLPGHNTHGGLVKKGSLPLRNCACQVKYRFCFTDLDPTESHADPGEHGFAYFAIRPLRKSRRCKKATCRAVSARSNCLPARLVGHARRGRR